MRCAALTLELVSPLHVGAGRSGMLARSHGFVPGHVLAYALAAAAGSALGGTAADYASALEETRDKLRCGPLLLLDADGWPLLPRWDRERIEQRFLSGSNHVALDYDGRSAVDSALFEVETIAPRVRGGFPVQVAGIVWFADDRLAGRPLADWLNDIRLGGELKMGMGRVRRAGWTPDAGSYAGLGRVDGAGLHLAAGEVLPGPALDGVAGAPLTPWLGRLYAPGRGFGQRFSPPALVRLDGTCRDAATFLPESAETGMGCWRPVHG